VLNNDWNTEINKVKKQKDEIIVCTQSTCSNKIFYTNDIYISGYDYTKKFMEVNMPLVVNDDLNPILEKIKNL
jgi:hypothetical protein